MKITKWLFILCLILFPLGEAIRISLFKDIYIKPLDIAVGLTVLSYCFHVLIHGNTKKSQLFWPIVYFVGACLLSLVVNAYWLNTQQLLFSFSYIVRWVAYAGLFFVVSSFDQHYKKLLFFKFAVVGTIFLFLGFIQYIWYPDLRNLFYLGWDEHLYRLFSVFLDPNFAAAFLVLFFLFLLILKKSKLLLVATLIGILLTYSRSGLLMLAVSITTYLLLTKRYLHVGVVAGLLLIYLVFASLFFKTENTNLFRTASSWSRIDSGEDALAVFRSSPIIGVGFNSYVFAKQKLGLLKPNKFENHANATTDTSLLFVLATTGMVGLISFLYLLSKIYYILFTHLKTNRLALVLFCFLTGLLVDSLVINSLFYSFLLFWIWSFLGIIERD